LDLRIENGDFIIGDSTEQNQHLLLLANKGEYKQYPKAGVGINGYFLDEAEQDMLREIRSQFENDGMKVKKLVYADGKLKIDAPYNS
jgi:hypothetical protein